MGQFNSKTKFTCNSIQSSIFLAPNEIRTCCKRFHVEGKLKGDATLLDRVDSNTSIEHIYNAKYELIDQINSEDFTNNHQCYGCPWLREAEAYEPIQISHISIEHSSVCNMRCSYCSETYYGGEKAQYDVFELVEKACLNVDSTNNLSIVFGGGEPVLDNNFENLLSFAVENVKANVRVFTNATIFSELLNRYIDNKQASITSSIDAGTESTFKQVRGLNAFNKVFKNLELYSSVNPSDVFIKYIFTNLNDSIYEIDQFCEKVKIFNLKACSFQISSDFKSDKLTDSQLASITYLNTKLVNLGITNIILDDHLAPRLLSSEQKDLFLEGHAKIIVWGAGEHSRRIFEKYGVERVKFFVDSFRFGKELLGRKIFEPSVILQSSEPIYIASVQAYNAIAREIEKFGCADRIIKS